MSLETTDAESAAVAAAHGNAPRVSLASMEEKIAAKHFVNATGATGDPDLCVLTICIVKMKNGFTLLGQSAPASPENFDKEYGEKLAYQDAIRQLWRLEGYLLREQLSAGS